MLDYIDGDMTPAEAAYQRNDHGFALLVNDPRHVPPATTIHDFRDRIRDSLDPDDAKHDYMLSLVAEYLSPTLRSPVARSSLRTSLNTARFEAMARFIDKLDEDGRCLLAEVLENDKAGDPAQLAKTVDRFRLNSITHKRALLAHSTLFVRAPSVHANNGNFTLYVTERAVAMLRYNACEYLDRATQFPTPLIAECELLMNSFRSGEGTRFATVTEFDWGNGQPLAALKREHNTLGETLDLLAGQIRAARRVLRVGRQYLSNTNPLRKNKHTDTLQDNSEDDTMFQHLFDNADAMNAGDEEGGVRIFES
nr:hypothetical protein B0A51_03873 [Rachicladosporium sp. CCFEE 5018]